MSAPIPTISLSSGAQVLQACVDPGFFYLCDHGIPQPAIDAMFERSRQLFLETDEETRLQHQDRAHNTGYTPIKHENLDASSNSDGDLKQSFYLASLTDAAQPEHQAPAQTLPPVLEQDRADLAAFVQRCKCVCDALLAQFGEAMALEDRGLFLKWHNGQHDRLRLIHYPPTSVPLSSNSGQSIRAGSHSDYGSCTLLFQKDVGGLQVQTAGGWIDIPAQPGCLVVNVGDAMEFWSGGAFRSTQHRVVLPRSTHESGSRFSMAYFCQPDEHAPLAPMPIAPAVLTAAGDKVMSRTEFEQRCKAKGVTDMTELTGGQHLRARLGATYSK